MTGGDTRVLRSPRGALAGRRHRPASSARGRQGVPLVRMPVRFSLCVSRHVATLIELARRLLVEEQDMPRKAAP
jgi:hypothetical protein